MAKNWEELCKNNYMRYANSEAHLWTNKQGSLGQSREYQLDWTHHCELKIYDTFFCMFRFHQAEEVKQPNLLSYGMK